MNYKNIIAFLIDTSAALIAFYLSLFIRLGEFDTSAYIAHGLVFAGIAVSMNYLFKIHRGIWRYFNFYYLYDIIKSASLAIAIFILVSFFSPEPFKHTAFGTYYKLVSIGHIARIAKGALPFLF